MKFHIQKKVYRKLLLSMGALVAVLIVFSMVTSPETWAAETNEGNVEMIEKGVIVTSESLNMVGPDSDLSTANTKEDPWSEGDIESDASLRVRVEWRNPKYASKARTPYQSDCRSTDYKVLTVYSNVASSYVCWRGSGTYRSGSDIDNGTGVSAVCPGKRYGQIYYQAKWGGNWFWSTYRGGYASNATCFYFGSMVRYRAIKLA